MTRKVFANDMVAHVWAQQRQAEGRSANGNFYFRDSTIYSYGSHYPIARFTDAYLNGARVVLFNSERSTVTTEGKHKNAVRHALRGLNVRTFTVPFVTEHVSFGYAQPEVMHQGNLDYYAAQFATRAADLANPRKSTWLGYDGDTRIDDTPENRAVALDPLVVEMHTYADAFNLTARPHVALDEHKAAIVAAFARFNDPAAVAKRAKARARREAKQLREIAGLIGRAYAYIEGVGPRLSYDEARELNRSSAAEVDRIARAYTEVFDRDPEIIAYRARAGYPRPTVTPEQWQEGKGSMGALGHLGYYPTRDTLLRKVGQRLETSRGAEVPWSHAVVAFYKAQRCRRTGQAWHRNGEQVPVGHFQVDRIDADGTLHAGCHTLDFAEMQRLAVREIPEQVRPTFPLPVVI